MARHAFWIGLIAVLVGGLGLAPAEARPPPLFPDVPHHHVTMRLDLAGHRIVATDAISFANVAPQPTRIRLNPDLKILSAAGASVEGGMNPVTVKPVDGQPGVYELMVIENTTDVELRYAGVIHDKVKKSDDISWVVGDDTKGVIDSNGVYLSGASGFIPRVVGNRLAAFDITTIVPSPYLTVTQGSVPARTQAYDKPEFEQTNGIWPGGKGREKQEGDRTYTVSVSRAVIPTDGVSLVAGKFATKSKVVAGVTLTTYFFEQDAASMDLWLDNCAKTVERYAPILGKYPHPKFDIVSNFFQTGYGMAGWTLLGDRVIRYVTAKARRSGNTIPPGYLDHEYVHGWYGNGLFVDYATGNWCEAITTYFANYLAKEIESKEAALEHRRGVLEKYAIRVYGEGDYALRKFVQKTEDKDNDIGYGKGSMLFHMLRKQVGDKVFFDTVLSFTKANEGKVVRWEDWFEAFSKASDQDIAAHIGPYLDRPNLPSITLAKAEPSQAEDGTWRVAVGLASGPKDLEPWPLNVPVRITLADGTAIDREASFVGASFETTYEGLAAKPVAVELDPGFDLLRRIPDADIPHCLNRTLETPGGTVCVVDPEQAFQAVAGRIARSKGFELKQGKTEVSGPTIIFSLGDAETGIEIDGKTWKGEDIAVLHTTIENGHPVTRFIALSKSMTPRAMYATYYGWDTYVVFQGHVPVARGIGRGEESSTRRKLASLDTSGVKATLEKLCSKELEGRRPGSAGHAKTGDWLRARLEAEGFEVTEPRFGIPVARRTSSRDFIVTVNGKEEVWKDAFRPLCFNPRQKVSVDIPVMDLHSFGSDQADAAVWMLGLRRMAQKKAPKAVVFNPGGKALETLPAWLDTPGDLTDEAKALLAKPGRDGKPRAKPPLESWIAGRRSRTVTGWFYDVRPEALEAVPPMIVLSEGVKTRLDILRVQDARVRFDVAFEPVLPKDGGRDLVAYLPAPKPTDAERPAVVVLCAHYDALGYADGKYHPGADDNASGVAAILEAVRGLREAWSAGGERRLGLMVCFTDCEEWGLWGSRLIAHAMQKSYDVRGVINVDSVGRALTKKTYVLGTTKHAKLAGLVGEALAGQGLELGTHNIDQYAYAWGSDHWPFHAAGIPAVGIWATDYAVMNTPDDTLDKVELEGVKKIAVALRDLILNHLDALTSK